MTYTAKIRTEDLFDDFALVVADFEGVEFAPVNKAIEKAHAAMAKAVEIAREAEEKAAYWTRKVQACTDLDKIKNEDTRRRAANLIARDFADPHTALDFLTCSPLDGISLLALSSGGRIPTNTYEAFAATRRGGLAEEIEIAETSGPVERYTYRLRILRGLDESRSRVFEWRRLARRCGFRLINKSPVRLRVAPLVRTGTDDNQPMGSGRNHDDEIFGRSQGRSRDHPEMGRYRRARRQHDRGDALCRAAPPLVSNV